VVIAGQEYGTAAREIAPKARGCSRASCGRSKLRAHYRSNSSDGRAAAGNSRRGQRTTLKLDGTELYDVSPERNVKPQQDLTRASPRERPGGRC